MISIPGCFDNIIDDAKETCKILANCHKNKGTIFSFGNGGSAAESDHLAAELIGIGVRSISLTNSVVLTALSNDLGYEEAVAHQLAVLGQKGDVFIGLTTSGKSKNLLRALSVAEAFEITRIVLTGMVDKPTGGLAAVLSEYAIVVPLNSVQRIQEIHLQIIHYWFENLKNQKGIYHDRNQ